MASYPEVVINFNVGVVGHIDSGKTSLAKALSTTASTASFDKCPQSQERGITVDLGFSSFELVVPPGHPIVQQVVVDNGPPTDIQLAPSNMPKVRLQFTLVDCPGHASLIRTIIGGSQIIDMMLLVVDVTKGMQTQTAECLVLGEITTSKMVVVLNKVDLLDGDEKQRLPLIDKMRKKMQKTMEQTKFAGCPIVAVAAKPATITEFSGSEQLSAIGLNELIATLLEAAYIPKRRPPMSAPFLCAVDHCFSIRGQGTIMTGTILSGSVTIGHNVEVASIKEIRKVKSIQMFRKPVEFACQGDRVGICVTQFDAKLLERGLVCTPGLIGTSYAVIATVRPIRFFKGLIRTKAKFHISLGHSTVMANCYFFESTSSTPQSDISNIIPNQSNSFDWNREYAHCDELVMQKSTSSGLFALLEFERPAIVPPFGLVIGSRLDADIHVNSCRLAFEGRIVYCVEDKSFTRTLLPRLKIFKLKSKEGIVERMIDPQNLIVRALFKKDSRSVQQFVGMRVQLSTGEIGEIEGNFGQSGKVKIRILGGLKDQTVVLLNALGKKRDKRPSSKEIGDNEPLKVHLTFKRYVFDSKKSVVQSS